jgi:hypothetical protein
MLFAEIPNAQRDALLPRRSVDETRMQRAAFSILGALLIAGSVVQMAGSLRASHAHWSRPSPMGSSL